MTQRQKEGPAPFLIRRILNELATCPLTDAQEINVLRDRLRSLNICLSRPRPPSQANWDARASQTDQLPKIIDTVLDDMLKARDSGARKQIGTLQSLFQLRPLENSTALNLLNEAGLYSAFRNAIGRLGCTEKNRIWALGVGLRAAFAQLMGDLSGHSERRLTPDALYGQLERLEFYLREAATTGDGIATLVRNFFTGFVSQDSHFTSMVAAHSPEQWDETLGILKKIDEWLTPGPDHSPISDRGYSLGAGVIPKLIEQIIEVRWRELDRTLTLLLAELHKLAKALSPVGDDLLHSLSDVGQARDELNAFLVKAFRQFCHQVRTSQADSYRNPEFVTLAASELTRMSMIRYWGVADAVLACKDTLQTLVHFLTKGTQAIAAAPLGDASSVYQEVQDTIAALTALLSLHDDPQHAPPPWLNRSAEGLCRAILFNYGVGIAADGTVENINDFFDESAVRWCDLVADTKRYKDRLLADKKHTKKEILELADQFKVDLARNEYRIGTQRADGVHIENEILAIAGDDDDFLADILAWTHQAAFQPLAFNRPPMGEETWAHAPTEKVASWGFYYSPVAPPELKRQIYILRRHNERELILEVRYLIPKVDAAIHHAADGTNAPLYMISTQSYWHTRYSVLLAPGRPPQLLSPFQINIHLARVNDR
ncbi:hypothetical protein [Pandoraea iniqua]|nr:hypothetical protein [Pandoraea iniqua]